MTIDTSAPRSRRALLAGGLGGVAAIVATAVGRPVGVRAADGQAVLVGGEYASSSVTKITATGAGAIAGVSNAHSGIVGTSTESNGVVGNSNGMYGTVGNALISAEAGVFGISQNTKTGVLGYSGAYGDQPAGVAKTGVYGYAAHDSAAIGVRGGSAAGIGVQGTSSSNSGVRGSSTSGRGVYGSSTMGSGVEGRSTSGIGVEASSSSGRGVTGLSLSAVGVYGRSLSVTLPAVFGTSDGSSTGVQGFSGLVNTEPVAVPRTGVYGTAGQNETAVGVRGDSPAGGGVVGFTGPGSPVSRPRVGVYGQANHGTSGVGVRGHSSGGIGVLASTATGTGLRVIGRVKLDDCAGVATIASGTSSVVVTPGIDLVATSAVLATLMGNAGGTTAVKRVAVDTTADTFTVHLTAAATANVKVAWIVLG